MPISHSDAQFLRTQGFTLKEIIHLSEATSPDGTLQPTVDIDSPVWRSMISDRIEIVNIIRDQWFADRGLPMTQRQLDYVINQWYAQGILKDVWDWIKATYRREKIMEAGTVRDAIDRVQNLRRMI